MPRLKLKYELNTAPNIEIEQLIFQSKEIDLEQDQDPDNPYLFKSAANTSYYVFPQDDRLQVFLLANGRRYKTVLPETIIWLNRKTDIKF